MAQLDLGSVMGPQGPIGATGPTGAQGATGATGATGTTGVQGIQGKSYNLKGTWASGTAYVNNTTTIDVVDYNGSSYACKTSHTASASILPTNTTYWQLHAQKGDTGPQGPIGATGATGEIGATGATGATGTQGIQGNAGATGQRGSQWFTGVGVTGTSTTGTVFAASGVTSAIVGDQYINTTTGYLYTCTLAGAASVAKWAYVKPLNVGDSKDSTVTFTQASADAELVSGATHATLFGLIKKKFADIVTTLASKVNTADKATTDTENNTNKWLAANVGYILGGEIDVINSRESRAIKQASNTTTFTIDVSMNVAYRLDLVTFVAVADSASSYLILGGVFIDKIHEGNSYYAPRVTMSGTVLTVRINREPASRDVKYLLTKII